MANLPPNHNEFALAAEAAPNNMNGWIEEEEDPEMEEEEDPEMEEEEEEMDVDADEEWDGPEWMLPYQGADPLNPPPPASDSESEIEFEEAEAEAAPIPPPPIPADHEPEAEAATVGTGRLAPLTRLFANTQVWTGSSSSSHCVFEQIENDDVRAENKRLRMMLDCSENRTRATWRELDRATWHYHNLRGWSIEVQKHLPPHLHYQEESICSTIMPPKAMSQATIERLITQRVNATVEAERARQVVFEKTKMVFGISECAEERKVKFAAATLQGRALTWWNSQRMEHELWNLKVKDFDISAYTQRFHELVQLVESTTRSRRLQPKSNTKNDRVPSTSKSSCIKNNKVEVEELHRILPSFNNQKHMSSECNNIKLAIRNEKSEVIYATCYQNLFMARRLGLFQAYDWESEVAHKLSSGFYREMQRFISDMCRSIIGVSRSIIGEHLDNTGLFH
ncbi:hypothetical protein Tco_0086062 [Tanacetum coccineum]